VNLARETAEFFIGTHDYTNLTIKAHEQKRMLRTVDEVTITEKDDQLLVLTFKSKAFLRRQVRNMVNLIIMGGQKNLTVDELERLLKSDKKEKIIRPAPAGGLYLTKIEYEEEYFKPYPLPLISW
jgi:tRNA pseudouridine38-40 synthase